MSIDKLTIIGVGLIGGSLGKALRSRGLVGEVTGYGRSLENLEQALVVGAIDRHVQSVEEAVADADLIVIGTPVGQSETVFSSVAEHAGPDCVITDVGSTKGNVAAAAQQCLGAHSPNFVPGHPIAGTERQGAAAADDSLFLGRRVILTPTQETRSEALAQVREMWQGVGAVITEMDAAHHDEVLAATSHLPHVLAYALVDQLAGMQEQREIFEYAAGGFRDFTRIASSSPEMWRDIVHANRKALLPVLDAFRSNLAALSHAIENDDEESLMRCFTRAKTTRDRLIQLADPATRNHPQNAED